VQAHGRRQCVRDRVWRAGSESNPRDLYEKKIHIEKIPRQKIPESRESERENAGGRYSAETAREAERVSRQSIGAREESRKKV